MFVGWGGLLSKGLGDGGWGVTEDGVWRPSVRAALEKVFSGSRAHLQGPER